MRDRVHRDHPLDDGTGYDRRDAMGRYGGAPSIRSRDSCSRRCVGVSYGVVGVRRHEVAIRCVERQT